ncbi:hypothetical protein LguiB_018053 [Lonicera macranthoides]
MYTHMSVLVHDRSQVWSLKVGAECPWVKDPKPCKKTNERPCCHVGERPRNANLADAWIVADYLS